MSVIPAGLPDAATLVAVARAAMAATGARKREAASRALNRYAPGIDQYTDMAGAAVFLGLKGKNSIRRRTTRTRADGTREWPEPDETFGRTPVWSYRTLVIHKAESPGQGHPGATLGRTNEHKKRPVTAGA